MLANRKMLVSYLASCFCGHGRSVRQNELISLCGLLTWRLSISLAATNKMKNEPLYIGMLYIMRTIYENRHSTEAWYYFHVSSAAWELKGQKLYVCCSVVNSICIQKEEQPRRYSKQKQLFLYTNERRYSNQEGVWFAFVYKTVWWDYIVFG